MAYENLVMDKFRLFAMLDHSCQDKVCLKKKLKTNDTNINIPGSQLEAQTSQEPTLKPSDKNSSEKILPQLNQAALGD